MALAWKKGDEVLVRQGSQLFPGVVADTRINRMNYAIIGVIVRVRYTDLAGIERETTTTVRPGALQRR